MIEILFSLTIGPYLCLWDSITKSSNSGHTAGIGEGLMMMASMAIILIHVVIVAIIGIPIYILS